jgi:hypothetical protein
MTTSRTNANPDFLMKAIEALARHMPRSVR